MIPPLFTQYDDDLGNRLNVGRPADDFATYGAAVTKSIAGVVSAHGTAEDPTAYAEKLAHRLFPYVPKITDAGAQPKTKEKVT
jgi:hypothetical protein